MTRAATTQPTDGRRAVAEDVREYWEHFRGYHGMILMSGAASGAAAVAELLVLATVAGITSGLGRSGPGPREVAGIELDLSAESYIVIAVVLVLVRCGFNLLDALVAARLGGRYEADKRSQLMDAYLGADWSMQSSLRGNELQDIATGSVAYGRIGAKAVASSAGSSVSAVIMLSAAFALSWVFSVACVALVVVLAGLIQPIVRRSKDVGEQVRDATLEYVAGLDEAVRLSREIRLTGVAGRFAAGVDAIAGRVRQARTHEQVLLNTAPSIFEAGAFLVVIGGIAVLHWSDVDGPARYIAMLLLLLRAAQYGRSLQATYHQAKAALPYLRIIDSRIEDLRSSAPPVGRTPIRGFSALELVDVSYAYDSVPVLQSVSLRIHEHEVLGVIGPSGSGKSTLMDILLGLRRPTSGRYLIDGVDQQELDPIDWHSLTAMVTQEPLLVEGDIESNIRFERDVSVSDLEFAIDASGLRDVVESLPAGLSTEIGPRSSGLSGGQRQRVSIARMMVGRPQLLVLDEPTSALDVHTESLILDAVARLRQHTTVVIVAHRLSTLRVCDRVAVIKDGRLEALASPESLAAQTGYFSASVERSRGEL